MNQKNSISFLKRVRVKKYYRQRSRMMQKILRIYYIEREKRKDENKKRSLPRKKKPKSFLAGSFYWSGY